MISDPALAATFFTVVASDFYQKANSGGPAWDEHYYLLTREQLDQYVRASGGKPAMVTP